MNKRNAGSRQDDRRLALPERIEGPLDVRSVGLSGLFLLASLYTIYFTRDFLLPIILAVLLNFVLWPLVRWLKRLGIPEKIGAALVLLAALLAILSAVYQLAGPAATWMAKTPQGLKEIQRQANVWRAPVAQVTRAAEEVGKLADLDGGESNSRTVQVQQPRIADNLLWGTWSLAAGTLVTIVLLYFLLSSGDLFLRKLLRILPNFEEKRKAVRLTRQLENNLSAYLFSVAVINLGLGGAVTLAMYLLGMPNPVLWGALATLLNFVPYVGAIVGLIAVSAAAAVTFEGFATPLMVASVYLFLTCVEGAMITPLILGRRLTLNPVVVFIGILFWGWLWGIPGVLLAVPILSCLKLLCEHVAALSSVGEFLGP